MKVESKKLDHGQIKLTITVSNDEVAPYLDRAAHRVAHKHQIPGFRPGKAPADMIKKEFGDQAIYEEALEELVRKTVVQAMKEEDIESVGMPEISVEKVAPGNPIVYSATVAVMPEITLGDWKSIRLKKEVQPVTDADVDTMVDELRGHQAKEALVDRAAKQGDKTEINFEVQRDGVTIDGGKGVKYPVIIGTNALIPGFEEHVIGMKAGEKKEFSITFPKPYFQEALAGKEAKVQAEMLSVFERTLPEKNDEWAKGVIGKPLKELLETLRTNLVHERESQSKHKLEHGLMEKIVAQAKFSDIPEVLYRSEKARMVHELKDDVARRGMKWDQYLQSIKKKEEELQSEFQPQADKRVKSALILRMLAAELKVTTTEDEIDKEILQQKTQYENNEEAQKQLAAPEYRGYLSRVLTNRKVIDTVVSLLTKEE